MCGIQSLMCSSLKLPVSWTDVKPQYTDPHTLLPHPTKPVYEDVKSSLAYEDVESKDITSFHSQYGDEEYFVTLLNGKYHSILGKAAVKVTNVVSGNLIREEWYRDGKRHREGDAAYIEYWTDKLHPTPKVKIWYIDGHLMRRDGKASYEWFNYTGIKRREAFVKYKGKSFVYHRGLDKPAIIEYQGGEWYKKMYYVDGTFIKEKYNILNLQCFLM